MISRRETMGLFHTTLNDVKKDVEKGDSQSIEKAKSVLNEHKENEVLEEKFVDSSLFSLKLYLENYIKHLDQAISVISEDNLTNEKKADILKNIDICKENISAFEKGVSALWKRKGKDLE